MTDEKDEKKEEVINIPLDDLTRDKCIIMKGNVPTINRESGLDSMEEYYFTCYLKEMIELGVVLDADKNMKSIVLSEDKKHTSTEILKSKTKISPKHLFQPATYTPDFNIRWNPEYKDVVFSLLNTGMHLKGYRPPFISSNQSYHSSVIELKGGFTNKNEVATLSLYLKWVFDKWAMYIQMVRVPNIFRDTFTPKEYMDDMVYHRPNSKKKIKPGDSKLKYKPKTAQEWFDEIKDLKPRDECLKLK
jgi:hypothetical protein